MKTAALIISYVLIGILAFFAFMQYKETQRLIALIPVVPPVNPNVPVDSNNLRTSVSGGDLWNELQKSVGEMKVDLTFKDNNA